jgi:hypothetical protein
LSNPGSAELAVVGLVDRAWGYSFDEQSLAFMWTANNDARRCVVFGDTAVRLPVVNGVS